MSIRPAGIETFSGIASRETEESGLKSCLRSRANARDSTRQQRETQNGTGSGDIEAGAKFCDIVGSAQAKRRTKLQLPIKSCETENRKQETGN
jgi:hypothetical protein